MTAIKRLFVVVLAAMPMLTVAVSPQKKRTTVVR